MPDCLPMSDAITSWNFALQCYTTQCNVLITPRHHLLSLTIISPNTVMLYNYLLFQGIEYQQWRIGYKNSPHDTYADPFILYKFCYICIQYLHIKSFNLHLIFLNIYIYFLILLISYSSYSFCLHLKRLRPLQFYPATSKYCLISKKTFRIFSE